MNQGIVGIGRGTKAVSASAVWLHLHVSDDILVCLHVSKWESYFYSGVEMATVTSLHSMLISIIPFICENEISQFVKDKYVLSAMTAFREITK